MQHELQAIPTEILWKCAIVLLILLFIWLELWELNKVSSLNGQCKNVTLTLTSEKNARTRRFFKQEFIESISAPEELLEDVLENMLLNLIQDESPSTNFSPVTSTNIENSLQNFLTFSFNPFAILM